MLAYAVIFTASSIFFVKDNIRNRYHVVIVALSILAYALMSFGNFAYALQAEQLAPTALWKFLAPSFVAYFVGVGVVDELYLYRKHVRSGAVTTIVTWSAGFLLFLPAFMVNLKIAGFLAH